MEGKVFQKIFGIAFIAIFGIYGIAVSVYQFLRGADGISDGIIVLFIGFVLCLIIFLSCFQKWGSFLRKVGHHGQADDINFAYEIKDIERSEKQSKEMREMRKKAYKENKFKKVCIAPCLICILGAVIIFAIAGSELSKIYSGIYVKAQAEIINYVTSDEQTRLVFQIIENGHTYITAGAESWSGVNFIEGNVVTVYHPALHPEVIWQPSTAIMLCVAGATFLLMSVIVFFATNGLTNYIGLPVGLVFAGVSIAFNVSLYVAGGFGFFDLIFSGGLVYACNAFICLGILFICVGCINVVRRFTGGVML
ncbi:MAG: hypothetical protein K2O89_07115 [Clostridia bacterium]|nr:hypothetical protein [Clostridia bacterium]